MRFLGIDYGSKRVGIALSDENGQLAFPFKVLSNNDELLDAVHNICGEQEVGEIVLGESLDFSGKENDIMEGIKEFKIKLLELGLPIHMEKEFMTTVEARGRGGKEINDARKVKQEKNSKVDASAAALILQRYLDRRSRQMEG